MTRGKQTLHLVGGGPGAVLALRAHFKAALAALPVEKPLVAYVGVASDDNAGFQKMLTGTLALSGARFRPAHIASPRASTAAARELLDEADLVFVSGGDVDHGMKVLAERDMLSYFRDLCRRGKPMFGISAGSIMLAREWLRFPDDDDAKAEIFECIGAVPFCVDAHSEEDDWGELRTLVALKGKRGDEAPAGYGLTAKGGVSVVVDGDRVTMKAIGTDIPRLVMRGGEVVHGRPLPCASPARARPHSSARPRGGSS